MPSPGTESSYPRPPQSLKHSSRDGFSRPVPRQPAHLHTQAESGAYLRDSSRVPRRRPFMKPPYAIGSVPSLSGHAIAYRWRSLPRVRRHRASKPQGSSERLLPWQVTMDQVICASLSHTHYWYEVGMLKVPAGTLNRVPRWYNAWSQQRNTGEKPNVILYISMEMISVWDHVLMHKGGAEVHRRIQRRDSWPAVQPNEHVTEHSLLVLYCTVLYCTVLPFISFVR